jgi:hypothetical protein
MFVLKLEIFIGRGYQTFLEKHEVASLRGIPYHLLLCALRKMQLIIDGINESIMR